MIQLDKQVLPPEEIAEILAIEITSLRLIVLVIYRPPTGSARLFLQHMNNILLHLSRPDFQLLVCGDFNINMLTTSPLSDDLLRLFCTFRLRPSVTSLTRPSSGTLIDQIWIPWDSGPYNSAVLLYDCSDHYPLLCSLPTTRILNPTTSPDRPSPTHSTRIISDDNITLFETTLTSTDWSPILTNTDPDLATTLLLHNIDSAYSKAFPLVPSRPTRSHQNTSTPWLTPNILAEIRIKHTLLRRSRLEPHLLTDYRNQQKKLDD